MCIYIYIYIYIVKGTFVRKAQTRRPNSRAKAVKKSKSTMRNMGGTYGNIIVVACRSKHCMTLLYSMLQYSAV